MLVLLFASMLLFAGLVLASTMHFLKSKRHHNTHSGSISKKVESDSSYSANSSCQTCHLCGGLRLRTRNAASLNYSNVSMSRNRHLDEASRPIQHQWAAMRTQMLLSIKQAIQKLITHHKKQAHVDFLMKLASSSNFLTRKVTRHSRDMCVVPTGLPASKGGSESSTALSLGTSIVGTAPNAIDAAATDGFSKLAVQDTQRSTEIQPDAAPVHRVVLEILVSPSGNSRDGSCTISPGITLKLETSHLAGCAEALKKNATRKHECTPDIAQVLHREKDASPKTSGSNCDHNSQRLSQFLQEEILSAKDEIKSSDFVVARFETAEKDPMLNACSLNTEFQALMSLKDCPQCCHLLKDNMEHEPSNSAASAAGKCSAQLKGKSSNCLCGSVVSDVAMQHMVEFEKGLGRASGMPLNNLGSLHISFSKSNEQESNIDVNSQAGSMLASLNVTDKVTGGISLGSAKKEKPKKVGVLSDIGDSHNSALIRVAEGEGMCEESSMKKELPCPLQGSTDISFSKRNKKKKKTKGKKPKANVESSVVDAEVMQEIGKVALESAKHVSVFPERELGCICGAMKGNLHNESCPYPFISPGSMLQRKMREQYNDLVRANATKTLTLAQVGQFTSCLVEAKATLKQKSESIQRKYTITKSLLSKADKSSFDRLCSQVYGLEMEQKKLEDDTVVYNRLQEQLKLSPAYQKMLEYGRAHFELQPHTGQIMEKLDPEDSEMSFEEFLEQEKKDEFWQRHNMARFALSAS
ncbi:hypothetical protein GOP47_0012235 [Adiantum capillus-veneris]|uniref:Uncharacterized protein n=1 Tax=Adiantum capillus-veneris TaxID=13818 RepID=A0A9D4ZE95_ADICA|nr:hypothetical protein GOP47_0012235 [Adiantum capillus-veneris]